MNQSTGAFTVPESRPAVRGPSPYGNPTHNARNDWVDVARGLTIVLVVVFHVVRGMTTSGLVSRSSPLLAVDYAVYTFHMPAFFFFAGLFLRRALNRPARVFWPNRVRTLLLPLVLWMTLEFSLLAATSSVSNSGHLLPSWRYYLLAPIAPFWFLHSLFTISAILYAARALPDRALLVLALLLYGPNWMLIGTAPFMVVQTVNGLVLVCLGMAFSPWIGRIVAPAVALPLAVLLFAAVGVQSYPLFLVRYPPLADGVAALMGVTGLVLLSQGLVGIRSLAPLCAPIRFLGQISLTVLVVHILGTAGMRITLLRVLHVRDMWVHLVADTAAGLLFGVAVQWLASRLGITFWLGLPDVPVRPMPRPARHVRPGLLR